MIFSVLRSPSYLSFHFLSFIAFGNQESSLLLDNSKLIYPNKLRELSRVESCCQKCGREYKFTGGESIQVARNFWGSIRRHPGNFPHPYKPTVVYYVFHRQDSNVFEYIFIRDTIINHFPHYNSDHGSTTLSVKSF